MLLTNRWGASLLRLAGIFLALLFTVVLLVLTGAPPFEAFRQIIRGAVGTPQNTAETVSASLPLLLATVGVLITFTAGLWNIGIEGQITMGAVFTTGAMRAMQEGPLTPGLTIALSIVAGAVGGALWAALAGILKTYGGVNEIFGGLGLNFVAASLNIYLIFGPWSRPGVASMSGTGPFPERLWMPTVEGLRLSPWAVVIALVATVLVYILLRGTYVGLKLKATGHNANASYILGIPTNSYTLLAFVLCGLLAGAAGAIQVTAVFHRLIPSISSGYGFLGLLVAMLINYQAALALPVSLFYAALIVGSIQLPIVLRLDSSLAGVLQGALVLFVLAMEGVRKKLIEREKRRGATA